MTDNPTPLPSRRAQREAREAAERIVSSVSRFEVPDFTMTSAAVTTYPSRRALHRTDSAPSTTTEVDSEQSVKVASAPTVGRSPSAVTTLHVEKFPTGEISGPIDHTGEIILTGPIEIPVNATVAAARAVTVQASPDGELPGIPRRATEALSIIGRANPIEEKRQFPSVGGGITAGFATFLGLFVLTLIGLVFFTDLI